MIIQFTLNLHISAATENNALLEDEITHVY